MLNGPPTQDQCQALKIKFAKPQDHLDYFNGHLKSSSIDDQVINTSYLLLDLPSELLEPVIKRFNDPHDESYDDLQMEFRGRNDEEVVLTTPDKTYQLRTVESSNSAMICGTDSNISDHPDQLHERPLSLKVFKVVHETIELSDTTTFPGNRLNRIKELLQPHLYTGEAHEINRNPTEAHGPNDDPPIVSFSSLSEQVRASDLEIRGRLEELHVVELNGALRMINLGYLSTILIGLLRALEELGVGPHEQFAMGPVVDIIIPRLNIHQTVLLQVLKKFLTIDSQLDEHRSHSYDSYDEHQTAVLKVQDVVSQIGLSQLLCIKPVKIELPTSNSKSEPRYLQTMNAQSFLSLWRSKLPASYSDFCSIENLESHSILSIDRTDLIVVPIDKLSLEPKARISQLFELQPKWQLDQIERFLNPVTGGGVKKKFDELILKFCRKIKEQKPALASKNQNLGDDQSSETIWVTARNKW